MKSATEIKEPENRLLPLLWRVFGTACVGVGAAGVFVPLLPTTPFLLLAGWAYGKGSERWRIWLVNHHQLGPYIRAWQDSRAIPRRAKAVAIVSLMFSLVIALWLSLPPLALVLQGIVLAAVAAFILTRPSS